MKKILIASSILVCLSGNALANDECIAGAMAAAEAAGNAMTKETAGQFCQCFDDKTKGNEALQTQAENYDPQNPSAEIQAVIAECTPDQ